jgi:uncharacterized membrane protein
MSAGKSSPTPSQIARRKLPRIVRVVRARPRLFLSAALGIVVALLLPSEWRVATRLLVGWDIGLVVYLVFAFVAMGKADTARIRRRAAMLDEDRVVFLVLTAAAGLASLAAIVAELGVKEAGREPAHLALAAVTIALSWMFTHTIFALHYAHEFYIENRYQDGGLAFPGKEQPDYWDFVYFSLVIGMTSQVSDVAVTAKPIRRTVTWHGVLSFFFNVTLLALTVNIAASVLTG